MESMEFKYRTGEHGTSRITRVYRSTCGRVGMVKRTAKYSPHEYGKTRVRYFDWNKPDNAPEYESLSECVAALESSDE